MTALNEIFWREMRGTAQAEEKYSRRHFPIANSDIGVYRFCRHRNALSLQHEPGVFITEEA